MGVLILIVVEGFVPRFTVSSNELKNSGRQSGYPEESSKTAPIKTDFAPITSAQLIQAARIFAFLNGTYELGISVFERSAFDTSIELSVSEDPPILDKCEKSITNFFCTL